MMNKRELEKIFKKNGGSLPAEYFDAATTELLQAAYDAGVVSGFALAAQELQGDY